MRQQGARQQGIRQQGTRHQGSSQTWQKKQEVSQGHLSTLVERGRGVRF